jgi:hypothetical protein
MLYFLSVLKKLQNRVMVAVISVAMLVYQDFGAVF